MESSHCGFDAGCCYWATVLNWNRHEFGPPPNIAVELLLAAVVVLLLGFMLGLGMREG